MQSTIDDTQLNKPAITQEDVDSEILEDLMIRQQRRKMFPRAALVGLAAGLVASGFRIALASMDIVRNLLIDWSQHIRWFGWVFPALFGMAGAVSSIYLVTHYAPETSGSGIPFLGAVLHRLRTMNWKRVLPIKFLAGLLAIGGGMTLGREGPTVQLGGAAGDAVAGLLRVPPRERRTLIAAGAGAGLAAAFNAPLAGVIFVVEEVQRDFHPFVFGAAFLAAVISDIVSRLLTGGLTVFSVPAYPTPPIESLPLFAVLGLFSGFLGVLFNQSLLWGTDFFKRFQGKERIGIVAGIGAMIGVIGWFSPLVIGGGHALTETILAGNAAFAIIPVYFLTRFFLTITSYGSGVAGGIFAPLLVLGSLLGLAVGQVSQGLFPAAVPIPAVFAVVGMAAYFTAIVRAPLTGIVLIVEMTGNYQQMLPLLVACFMAYVVAEFMRSVPIYEALLERDLKRDGSHINIKEPMVVDLVVEQGASFAGLELRSLGLPPGCVLVRCRKEGHDFVPTARTRLEPLLRITAVVAPEAIDGLTILRNGCKADNDPDAHEHA